MNSSELDSIDWNILSALQENARIANVDLADKVHLSPSPCLARVKALEQDGFISRYVTLLNAQAVGLGVSVFVQVRLEKQVEASLNTFEKAIAARPEVMECYLMTGSSDYLLRVVVSDLQEFQSFVTDRIKNPGSWKYSVECCTQASQIQNRASSAHRITQKRRRHLRG